MGVQDIDNRTRIMRRSSMWRVLAQSEFQGIVFTAVNRPTGVLVRFPNEI